MATLNFDEGEMAALKAELAAALPEEKRADFEKLCEGIELGLRGYRVLLNIKPLITAVWVSMSENQDGNRFGVERMLKDIDGVLSYWVVPEDPEAGKTPDSGEE